MTDLCIHLDELAAQLLPVPEGGDLALAPALGRLIGKDSVTVLPRRRDVNGKLGRDQPHAAGGSGSVGSHTVPK
ncbi:MAG: hypothetical protein LC130_22435 [Bryobacterales bacterium]|nr:hypothetical protein [Bryobacterales bacterium]